MLAAERCEALCEAMAAEIAASILDVAILRCRGPALAARAAFSYAVERERSQRRHLRDAPEEGLFGAPWFRERVAHYSRLREEAYRDYSIIFRGYRADRRWQNRRYGLPPRARFRELPELARELR